MRDDGGWLTCNGQGRKKGEKEQRLYRSTIPPRETRDPLGFFKNRKKTPPECVRSERKCGIAVTQTVQMKWSFLGGVGEWDEVKTIVLGTTRGK